jgi:hypothetical protein
MPRSITITFNDGTAHKYENIPDSVTPEMVEARAKKDFSTKTVKNIDGGRPATAQPASSELNQVKKNAGIPTKDTSADKPGFFSNLFSAAKDPKENVKLNFINWKKEGFDLVFTADFTITNNNPYPIKDIEIESRGFAESETKIDRNNRTLYTTIKPGETKTFNNFNMGFMHSQVKSISLYIKNVEKVE